MYHISTISDILRQGVDSLAQWLEHWISTPAVGVRIPSGTWDFFQTMHHFLVTNFHIRKNCVARLYTDKVEYDFCKTVMGQMVPEMKLF